MEPSNLVGSGTIDAHLNIFDMVVIGIVGLSCLVSFFRGFMRELLSLGAWLVAGLVTIYAYPHVAEFVKPHVKNSESIAMLVAILGTYIVTLLFFSIINGMLIRYAKQGAEVGMLDNILGLVFGFLRGSFIVSLGFFLMSAMMDKDQYPDWVAQARTLPFAESGARLLARLAPHYLEEMSSFAKDQKKNAEDSADAPEDPPATDGKSDKGQGYSNSAREQMERLLNSTDEKKLPETIDNTDAPAPVHYR